MGNLTLNGATSGQITLAPPAVAGTNTISLPAQTATVLTDSSAAMNIGSGQIYKDASGNVGIGVTSPNGKLEVAGTFYQQGGWTQVGAYNAGSVYPPINGTVSCGIAWNFSAGGREIALMNNDTGPSGSDGGFRMYQRTGTSTSTRILWVPGNGVYNNTTASAANVYIDSSNLMYRSTSSLKYKTDVKDATHGLAEVMQLRPVTYKGKNDGDTVFGGLIAEEVDAVGLTEFVQYAEDGSPDALSYGNMVSLLVKAMQEQQSIIEDLKARLAVLEAK